MSQYTAPENEVIPYQMKHSNGITVISAYQKDGEFHGPYASKDKTGELESTGGYYEGKRIGVWTLYQEGRCVLYNKDGEVAAVAPRDQTHLLFENPHHEKIFEEVKPLIEKALKEVREAVSALEKKEAAYRAYRANQIYPDFDPYL